MPQSPSPTPSSGRMNGRECGWGAEGGKAKVPNFRDSCHPGVKWFLSRQLEIYNDSAIVCIHNMQKQNYVLYVIFSLLSNFSMSLLPVKSLSVFQKIVVGTLLKNYVVLQ